MPRRGIKVAVCACTFRRPEGLAALLAGLKEQRFRRIPAPRVLIIIVDNDGSAEAQALCKAAAAEQGLRVRYVVEDRRGISFARNCCLEAVPVDADFIAMIDDDERPDPEWLEELLLAQAATGADVVQGRVEPVFAGSVPAWIRDGGFFGYPKQPSPFHHDSWADLQEVPAAASGNVLIHAAAISVLGLRFDPRLGLTGGSDALFFRALRAAGNRIVYAKRAVVHEDVPADRTTLSYLCRRSYRDGSKRLAAKLQAKAPAEAGAWRVRSRLAARACGQATAAVFWLLGRGVRARMNRIMLAHGLVELANAFGTLAACAGLAYEHYRRAGDTRAEAVVLPR